MNLIYQNYHKHTDDSNIMTPDSPVKIEDYAKRCVELGHKVLSSVEHGWQGQYYRVYETAKKYGLKFIFGTEAYWVKNRFEKDDTNGHIIILAKNEEGRQEINDILSEANITGYYKKPRVDLELILSLNPKNVFLTSACIMFWRYGNMEEIVQQLHNHFKENFMLEVQYHNTPAQINLNRKIKQLSQKYGIKMIMGCDSHFIYPEQEEDRNIILEAKNIRYEEEEGWYLDYPDGETAFQRLKDQGIFTDEEILEMMNNTNILLEFDDIEFDKEIKLPSLFPHLSQEEKDKLYDKILVQQWNKIKHTIPKEKHAEYIREIKKEAKVVRNTKMADYFILDYYIVERGKQKGGVITYTGRGSGSGFYTNTLLGFSNIDRISAPVKLYPERFMSETRILETRSLPDLDLNLGTPEIFAEAQRELLGEDHSYPMIAFGTFKIKSAFKMYARANNLPFDVANEVTKQLEKYEQDLKYAEEDEKDLINVYDYVDEKYHHLIDGSKKYQGIISDKKPHPCGYIVYQGSIRRELGLMKIKSQQTKKEVIVTVIDGGVAEDYKFLKNDLLKVDVVNTIHQIYKKIGIPQHTINELMEITKNDEKTWDIYAKGLTLGVNQVEKEATTQKVMRYKPRNISELTAFIAAIRPSFKSMYHIFEKREPFSYGIKVFDDLIQTEEMPYSFVLYQEQMMATLQYAGFPSDETYGIIKAISKKKPHIVLPLKERFIEGFSKRIIESESHISLDEAKEMSEKVWKIIEDSSNYGFNSSHAYCYAFDSLYGAYLKAHYPYEFYSVMLNTYTEKGDKEKVSALIQEMGKGFGIKLGEYKFGLDNREFAIDKENGCIHPDLSAIKFLNKNIADELYELGKNHYNCFVDLLYDMHHKTRCTFKHMRILATLNYFKDFGGNQKILSLIDMYESKLKNKNLKDETKMKRLQELKEYEASLPNSSINIKDQIKAEIEYLGQELTTIKKSPSSVYMVTEIDTKYTPKLRLYNLKTGEVKYVKCRKNDMKKNQFGQFNIIQVKKLVERNKRKKVNDEWVETDEKELYLTEWNVLK